MIKHIGTITAIILGLLAPFVLTAQLEASPSTIVATTDDSLRTSLLYRISGNGLNHPSWLFGTIHIILEDDFFLTENTKKAFEQAERIVFEIDMNEMMGFGAQLALMSKAMMDDGLTLRDLLSEEEYALVKAHFEQIGLPLFLFERFKPMFLTVFAADTKGAPPFSQPDGMVSYEIVLMEMAHKQGKEIAGLETAEFQMSLFDSIPYETQAKMLVESIRQQNDSTATDLSQLYEWYKQGDIDKLQQSIEDDEMGLANYEDLLLIQRNESWIPIMERMMHEKPSFFAVGAGHLGGPKGVINLLRQAGYRVEPVPME